MNHPVIEVSFKLNILALSYIPSIYPDSHEKTWHLPAYPVDAPDAGPCRQRNQNIGDGIALRHKTHGRESETGHSREAYRINPSALFEGVDRVENDNTLYFCSFSTASGAQIPQDISPIIPAGWW
jgi:hypothetical protein